MLTLAARVPDHGKLSPWRFIILAGAAKSGFVDRLDALAGLRPGGSKLQVKLGKLRVPPLTVAVVSRPVGSEIPEWEQTLSAGAVCLALLIAAQAMGFGANWITDWYAYDGRPSTCWAWRRAKRSLVSSISGRPPSRRSRGCGRSTQDLVRDWADQRPR